MGYEADAYLAYGVILGQDPEDDFGENKAPWHGDYDQNDEWVDEYDGDIDEWWRATQGYTPPWSWDSMYDKNGKLDAARADGRMEAYFEHRKEWEKDNPLPFLDLSYISYDYPERMVCLPGKIFKAYFGSHQEIEAGQLFVEPLERESLLRNLENHGIRYQHGPGWFLVGLLSY